jgi:hypothetical protein
LFRDNIPVISLASWDLEADMFDGEFLSGVVPVLFSDCPPASEAAIRANQLQARKDVEAINKLYFQPETVELEEALRVVRKPRIGEGEFVFRTQNLDRLFQEPDLRFAKPGIH